MLFFVLGPWLIRSLRCRIMTVHLPVAWKGPISPLFIKCLKSLPNLHTLEIGACSEDATTTQLKKVFGCVKLPQIKTLIIPPSAYPLLQHCCDVEDVICVAKDEARFACGFPGSLASNQDSKIERLAIPLTPWPNSSRE